MTTLRVGIPQSNLGRGLGRGPGTFCAARVFFVVGVRQPRPLNRSGLRAFLVLEKTQPNDEHFAAGGVSFLGRRASTTTRMREMHVATSIVPKAVPKAYVPKRILNFEASEEELIDWYMRGVLEKTRGNQSEAQRVLEIARTTVRRRMAKLGIIHAARRHSRRQRPRATNATNTTKQSSKRRS
jgi:hypothetical protein